MGSIKDFFIKLFSDSKSKVIIVGISMIIALFLLNRWNYNRFQEAKQEAERMEANLSAAQDTIRVTKAKNGALEYDKKIYIAKNTKELKLLNDSLARQIELTKGNVGIIANVGIRIQHDTISLPTTVYVTDSVI